MTDPLDGRRSRWWETDDVHAWTESSAELAAVYGGLEPAEAGTHLQALVGAAEEAGLPDGHRARYTVQFTRPAVDARPQRPARSAGRLLDDLEPEARRTIRHVYLPPMRNAQQELASSSGNRLRLILAAELGGEEAIKAFETEQVQHFRGLERHDKIKAARKRINDPLALLPGRRRPNRTTTSRPKPRARARPVTSSLLRPHLQRTTVTVTVRTTRSRRSALTAPPTSDVTCCSGRCRRAPSTSPKASPLWNRS
ncbi:hypothetical protein [Streptomyces sp. NPDC090798]|uniref:hypothetical protein n=1 Tax=Streptomyces sp. NPDC090798 TaxID=3365968 RepID=UPI00382C2393